MSADIFSTAGSDNPLMVDQAVAIRPCHVQDMVRITEIYNQAVLDGGATADTDPVNLADRTAWFQSHRCQEGHPILVAQVEGRVQAFGSLSTYYDRPGYELTAELGYYVDRSARRKGLASALVSALLGQARDYGLRLIVALIFDDNMGSKRVLEQFGFDQFGILPKGARDRYHLHDVSYWFLSL